MLSRDIGFALRTLRKNPAFAITAILTIALGIGASTAIFSVVNAVLLRPLPYRQPDRLALIWTDMRARKVTDFPFPPADYYDLTQQATAFEAIAAANTGRANFVGRDGKPEQVTAANVTTNFFTVLGSRIAYGRNFVAEDGTPPARPPLVNGQPDPNAPPPPRLPIMTILSHQFWESHFAGDSSVVGKTVQINGGDALIVGVAEPEFRVVFRAGNSDRQPDLYQAIRQDFQTGSRVNLFLRPFGRLKPGATVATAQAQVEKLATELRDKFPIKKSAGLYLHVEPMQADLVKSVRPAILALMGAVMFVLLIACANVANLLLVRASSRERELAVRAAVGGSRQVLIAQMLAESLVLSVTGAALGLLLANAGIDLLLSIAPANLPRVSEVSIDPMVLGFTIVVAVVSAFVFGVLPALRASSPNLAQTLRAGGRSPGLTSGKRLRQGVVIAEVALSFVLLVGSGLMLRSFIALSHTDPGFDPNGMLTFNAFNTQVRSAGEAQAFVDQFQKRLEAIPGVTAVTAATPLPLDGQDQNMRWGPPEAQGDPTKFQQATMFVVRPGYFTAMKTKLLAGHDFGAADNTQTSTGVIIDDLFAAKAFPGQSPQSIIGKQLYSRINTPEAQWYQVIGVAQHQRHLSLAVEGREGMWVAENMFFPGAASRWAVRTNGDPTRLIPELRRAIADVNPLVPLGEIKPMSDYVDRAMAPTRFSLVLIAVFGAVAAVLAAVGLYGVLATAVRQRTAEIGIRMAFGATSDGVFRLIIGQGLGLSAVGIGVGLLGALALTRVMERASMLVSIKATDPLTYVAMTLLFVGIAAVACWVPARRAALLDPNVALREE
jgi:putative ABC transport system permease protein